MSKQRITKGKYVGFRADDEMVAALESEAGRHSERSVSWVVRDAVRQYLDKLKAARRRKR